MRLVFLILVLPALAGCDEEAPHPNQQAVDRAEKLTDDALHKAEQAERELQHERRLRDLDKVSHEAEVGTARSELVTWRGLLIGLSVVLVVLSVWLARELRCRRILAHVVRALSGHKEVKRE